MKDASGARMCSAFVMGKRRCAGRGQVDLVDGVDLVDLVDARKAMGW